MRVLYKLSLLLALHALAPRALHGLQLEIFVYLPLKNILLHPLLLPGLLALRTTALLSAILLLRLRFIIFLRGILLSWDGQAAGSLRQALLLDDLWLENDLVVGAVDFLLRGAFAAGADVGGRPWDQ